MKVKKLLSTFAALAIAASSFAGLGINASAEGEATVLHTASQTAGAAKRQWSYTLDQEDTPAGLNKASSNADAGYAYVQISLPASETAVKSAKLTLPLKFTSSSGDRITTIKTAAGFSIPDGTAANTWNYDAANADYAKDVPFGSWDGGTVTVGTEAVASYNYTKGTAPTDNYQNTEFDVTEAVQAVYTANDDTITFAVSGESQGPAIQRSGISLALEFASADEVGYTVKYFNSDNQEIKEADTTRTVSVGDTVTVTDEDKAAFKTEGDAAKYIFDSENINNVTSTAVMETGTELKLYFKSVPKYNVSAKTSTDAALSSGTVFSDEAFTYSYPMYLTDENAKITHKSNATTYTASKVPERDNDEIVVEYTASDKTAYFKEHEAITDTTAQDSANYSGGRATRAVTDGVTAFTVTESGKYSITVAGACRNINSNSTFAVYKNTKEDAKLLISGDVKGASMNNVQANGTKTTENIELNAGDVIIIAGDNGNTWIDYIYAEKTGELAPSIAAVATETPDGVTAPSAPTTVTALDGITANYADLTADKTVTTIYVKVDNGSDDVKPVITLSNGETMTVTKASYDSGYFICQYVGNAVAKVAKVTYTGAADWSAPVTE